MAAAVFVISFLSVVLSGSLKHTDWTEEEVNTQRYLTPSLPDLRVTGTVNLAESSPQLPERFKIF